MKDSHSFPGIIIFAAFSFENTLSLIQPFCKKVFYMNKNRPPSMVELSV